MQNIHAFFFFFISFSQILKKKNCQLNSEIFLVSVLILSFCCSFKMIIFNFFLFYMEIKKKSWYIFSVAQNSHNHPWCWTNFSSSFLAFSCFSLSSLPFFSRCFSSSTRFFRILVSSTVAPPQSSSRTEQSLKSFSTDYKRCKRSN